MGGRIKESAIPLRGWLGDALGDETSADLVRGQCQVYDMDRDQRVGVQEVPGFADRLNV